MPKIGSPIPYPSKEHSINRKNQELIVNKLTSLLETCLDPKNDENIAKHTARGKLFVRERIKKLIDFGSPFFEISTFACLNVYEGVRPGAGIVTGIGVIAGKQCMIIANDATVKGGCYFPLTVKKHLRAQEIALENNLPCIYLVDSGGAFLPLQDEVFPDKEHFGRIFYNQARMSAKGIPQISVVMGSCTAGGAYVPAMSDETIIVKGSGTIFLGGPPLVKAATGEDVTAEELGGADVHTSISGVADYLADSDLAAIKIARDIAKHSKVSKQSLLDITESEEPNFLADEIYSLIPSDSKKYFPMREILARIIDASYLDEFKAEYGKTLICGFARIQGILTGIIANDGILFSESAQKGAHFIQICDKRRIPLIFFQNISGFMVGKEYEHKGIAKDGAKLVTAVASTNLPKITFIVGGSFGAGNYAMSGRAYQPNFLFTWPNSKISVMGPQQAGKVLTQIKLDSLKAKGNNTNKKQDSKSTGPSSKEEILKYETKIISEYEAKADAYYATARIWDDGIIYPHETRKYAEFALRTSSGFSREVSNFGIFRL